MSLVVAFCIIVQAVALFVLVHRLKGRFLGKIGFLLMAITFLYHGMTEIAQAIFPGLNPYTSYVTPDALDRWVALITIAMSLFICAYLLTLRRQPPASLPRLLDSLAGAYLLKWPVLLGSGVLGLALIMARRADSIGSYWIDGLADQFTILLLGLSLATLCLITKRNRILWIFLGYAVMMTAYGNREPLLLVTVVALYALYRYGARVPIRMFFVGAMVLGLCFSAISTSRQSTGRFAGGEDIGERVKRLSQPGLDGASAVDSVLGDTIYRFDGNSYGAMILEKQEAGYGFTGFPQVMSTINYMMPSFINVDKLDTQAYMRNEEAYQDVFYQIPDDIDYISDFWTIMLGYIGAVGLLLAAPVVGWSVALLDSKLEASTSPTWYITGISLSLLALNIEGGLAGIPYTLRGLVLLLTVAKLMTWRRRGKKVISPARFARHRAWVGVDE